MELDSSRSGRYECVCACAREHVCIIIHPEEMSQSLMSLTLCLYSPFTSIASQNFSYD